jgi:hypothetical protein
LPQEYKVLVDNDLVYDAQPIDSPAAYYRIVGARGYYRENLGFLLGNPMTRSIIMGLVATLRALRAALRHRPQP